MGQPRMSLDLGGKGLEPSGGKRGEQSRVGACVPVGAAVRFWFACVCVGFLFCVCVFVLRVRFALWQKTQVMRHHALRVRFLSAACAFWPVCVCSCFALRVRLLWRCVCGQLRCTLSPPGLCASFGSGQVPSRSRCS